MDSYVRDPWKKVVYIGTEAKQRMRVSIVPTHPFTVEKAEEFLGRTKEVVENRKGVRVLGVELVLHLTGSREGLMKTMSSLNWIGNKETEAGTSAGSTTHVIGLATPRCKGELNGYRIVPVAHRRILMDSSILDCVAWVAIPTTMYAVWQAYVESSKHDFDYDEREVEKSEGIIPNGWRLLSSIGSLVLFHDEFLPVEEVIYDLPSIRSE